MKSLMSATALIVAISITPTIAAASNYNDAHERCKRGENNRQIVSGIAGAVLGGVVGSQISGNGARTEGSAIGAVIGGLAGAGIADKSIDCDPNYGHQTSSVTHTQPVYAPTQAYNPAPAYGSTQPQYGSTQSQYSSTQSQYGSTQSQYEDRVTVSNHPVYSDPYYGAGAVSQGRTYATGNVTYPPSGHNTQYASQTYSAPAVVHTQAVHTPTVYRPTVVSTQPVYRPAAQATTTRYYSASSQPAAQRVVYSPAPQRSYTQAPSYRTVRPYKRAKRSHHHGQYSCNTGH